MKVLRIIPVVLIVLTWACTETAFDERQVLTKEELQFVIETNSDFAQYIDVLVDHEGTISERIDALSTGDFDLLRDGIKQFDSFEEFSEGANPELVEIYNGVVATVEDPSLHLAALVTQLDTEYVYERKDLFDLIGQRLQLEGSGIPQARVLDRCDDVYWEVYTERLNDNYYRLGMSLNQADANAVRDASWAKVGCRMSR